MVAVAVDAECIRSEPEFVAPIICACRRRSLVLDTNALIELLESRARLIQFGEAVRLRQTDVYLPVHAVDEIVVSNESTMMRRVASLSALFEECDRRVFPLLAFGPAVEHELELPRSEVGVGDPNWLLGVIQAAQRGGIDVVARRAIRGLAALEEQKKYFFARDRTLASTLGSRPELGSFTPEEVARTLTEPFALRENDLLLELIVTRAKPRYTAQEIIARPERFPVQHLGSQLLLRQMLANLVRVPGLPPRLAATLGVWWTKSESRGGLGAWNDCMIAGPSARADLFVTNDSNLRARLDALRRFGIISPTSVPLNAYLRA